MKKRLSVLLALAFPLTLAGCYNETRNLPDQQPDYAYELDTWQENSEVYEFTPKATPNLACVMLMLDNGKDMGLSCIPKGPQGKAIKLLPPDFAYELDTWLENSELYEFTPRSNTTYSCIMYMLDAGNAMGLRCNPKTDQAPPALPAE
ncbi:hypothetical protein MD588_13685 [Photobacterium sp. SDRW27]|uniref:hypothetical protein n=1 Tax=Photobacterium obscurum TaxID=2829490 RepID=UPI002244C098|nr:hypothetical protein [Photobacterium obscurum]MCW8329860.1 hypothetical protein [Photobacterium obscurum]